jgi:hypothetical protein
MKLDSTFDKLIKDTLDEAGEAMRAYNSLRPENRTPAVTSALVRMLKEADAPVRQYVQTIKMLAKIAKLIPWLEGKDRA